MAKLDRPAIIDLLGRLGAESDATALEAARELHRQVSEAGSSWDHLLRADLDMSAAADAPLDDAPADDEPAEAGGEVLAADKADAARLLDRLLARKNISSTLREDLTELKRTLADGEFDAMDARYVRALAKRLGA